MILTQLHTGYGILRYGAIFRHFGLCLAFGVETGDLLAVDLEKANKLLRGPLLRCSSPVYWTIQVAYYNTCALLSVARGGYTYSATVVMTHITCLTTVYFV